MLQQAIQWIHNNHLDGQAIPITDKRRRPYPEVTGYFIPTLLSIGEIGMAEGFARWLVTVQQADGAFTLDDPNKQYVFDTGQVIRGWVTVIDRLPELAEPLKRACDWIIRGADPVTGRLQVPAPGGDWSLGPRGEVSEGIHLYVLQPLRDAADKLKLPYIREAADKALAYYLANVPVMNFAQTNMLTHFYGYMQEALFEMGCIEECKRGMASVQQYQLDNGAVTAYYDVPWVCSTGLAQLAKVWYFLGDLPRADRAMEFLEQLQNGSGGFYGSYGAGATYFPADEISWAAKYAIEAEHLRIARHVDRAAQHAAPTIAASAAPSNVNFYREQFVDETNRKLVEACRRGDRGWIGDHLATQHARHPAPYADELYENRVGMQLIAQLLARAGATFDIVDVGCGNAMLVRQLRDDGHRMRGVDASAVRVANNQDLGLLQGFAESIPLPDQSADVVICLETLSQVFDLDKSLRECLRLLRHGGLFLCQVPQGSFADGSNQVRSFDAHSLRRALEGVGMQVIHTWKISYLNNETPNNLFIAAQRPGNDGAAATMMPLFAALAASAEQR